MSDLKHLPVAVIGAGPVGLAAAAELIGRGLKVKVYEKGDSAANLRNWSHVRLFSPWRYNIADAAHRLLSRRGWTSPDPDGLPTGAELCDSYLKPLAALPELAAVIETNARVTAIARLGIDKVASAGREVKPFVISLIGSDGLHRSELARAVIDASGTWQNANPLGANGLPVAGEAELGDVIAYGIPDVLGREREVYARRNVLVVGGGHSAANALLDLHRLATEAGPARILWATRSANLARIFGGGAADELPARGELGAGLRRLVESRRIELVAGFAVTSVRRTGEQVFVEGEDAAGHGEIGPVDRIVVATGQRPDLGMTRELRLELDPWLESTRALGPLIDPNVHSCGSVPPHGHRELTHPEPGFYTIGVKSYGRAPTFLLLTGYEQARSVVAAIAGDIDAADTVRLVLPETGVCSVPTDTPEAGGCCGGPAPDKVNACCVADVVAKTAGKDGCGCKVAA
jgi:hypothetical protein